MEEKRQWMAVAEQGPLTPDQAAQEARQAEPEDIVTCWVLRAFEKLRKLSDADREGGVEL